MSASFSPHDKPAIRVRSITVPGKFKTCCGRMTMRRPLALRAEALVLERCRPCPMVLRARREGSLERRGITTDDCGGISRPPLRSYITTG